ncbi:MAG: L,D-transpeptidase family protein [Candidatus Omnitrophota bacterium]
MRIRLLFIIGVIIIASLAALRFSGVRVKNLPREEESQDEGATLTALLNQIEGQESKGNLLEVKALYKRLIAEFPNSPQIGKWQDKAWDLNIKLLFSPMAIPGSTVYEIKSGDSLDKIAKKFGTTIELLKISNNLSTDVIITGKKLKAWTKPFNIVVDKSQNSLILKSSDEVVKIYVVATGLNNSTPIGTFKIVNRLIDPPWYKAGAIVPAESPDNILGSRWMGFDLDGYGIHGTIEPETLGQQITQGCVRMSKSDVEELYAIIPAGTEVTIVD